MRSDAGVDLLVENLLNPLAQLRRRKQLVIGNRWWRIEVKANRPANTLADLTPVVKAAFGHCDGIVVDLHFGNTGDGKEA